jgi:ataxia telangiectasia mutated family protein
MLFVGSLLGGIHVRVVTYYASENADSLVADRSMSAHLTVHIQPRCLVDLLRTTLGLNRVREPVPSSRACGLIAQAWEQHLKAQSVIRYLLLLDDPASVLSTTETCCTSCPKFTGAGNITYTADSAHFQSTRKLILELISPKLTDLLQSWKGLTGDRASAISPERFLQSIYACMTILLLMPHFATASSLQFRSLQADLESMLLEILTPLRDTEARSPKDTDELIRILLEAVQPELPICSTSQFTHLSEKAPHLQQFLVLIAESLGDSRHTQFTSEMDIDMIDITDFTSQQSQSRADGHQKQISRNALALDLSLGTFRILATERIMLTAAMDDTSQSFGTIPSAFIDRLLGIPIEDLLSCRRLLTEIFESDLIMIETDAGRLLEHLGELLASNEWSRCEALHCLCLDVLIGLGSLWSQNEGTDLDRDALQIYSWFIDKGLDQGAVSPETLKSVSMLLLSLMKFDFRNAALLSMRSPRSSLLLILEGGSATVKFHVGARIPEIFELYLLKDHENTFVDVLDKLPRGQDWHEGIALRLFVLARLASRWTSLLRRCIYHVFEAPIQVPYSAQYAARCLIDISSSLRVEGPRELFSLFAPQLLYTYLENEDIREIPFEIFAFETRKEMVANSQHVAAGLMVMRGQAESLVHLGELLDLSEMQILQSCFTNIMAYSIAYAMTIPSSDQSKRQTMGEAWVKKRLGNTLFFECIHLHFSEIIALLFNTVDQGDVEKYLLKQQQTAHAGMIMREIKSTNASGVVLPPNQQPNFKARYLTHWISHICSRTHHEEGNLYTPALVVFIARSLLNTIHPALGSLHACSVMRKVRLLISLSGDVAVQGYPLEMLLPSVGAFINDAECADDCFGIIQYLLTQGMTYLLETPSFVAGIALNILGSLGRFLRPSQASSTQDTQYQDTLSKAMKFQTWMKKYVSDYDSSLGASKSHSIFQAIVKCADTIGMAGNATIGTPESELLFHLLEDQKTGGGLLSQPSREAALAVLCSEFHCPASFQTDMFGKDALAIANAAFVWNSCKGDSAGTQYLSWAGRVLGRAFVASGHVHQELLRESDLSQIMQLSTYTEDFSRGCILSLLQSLTLGQDRLTVGLAEAALCAIVSTDDVLLTQTCQNNISDLLYAASLWSPYYIPPSQAKLDQKDIDSVSDPFTADAILRPFWLRDLAIVLARFVPDDTLLRALMPILHGVPGFAGDAFPFILHLVLSTPSQAQLLVKRKVSDSLRAWFKNSDLVERNKLKILINSILYLRTQPLVAEKSSADRSYWLDIDYLKAAVAATRCGMFKTALLFVEQSCVGPIPAKSSRRSSNITREASDLPTEILLTIFQNIDDPDLYYGIQQNSSLSTILARLEYERDGTKSLAFRGAQYDSDVRRKDPRSAEDIQSLVKALDVLNLSGLSHSLLQVQQSVGMSSASLESMFTTARKLEQWDIPVPESSKENAVTIYKAFQAIHDSTDSIAVSHAINEGLECTMSSLIRDDLNASALHSSLRTLSALVEVDEVLSTRGSEQFEELLEIFRSRSEWMETGR